MAASSTLSAAWLRALELEFADSLSPDDVTQIFKPHLDEGIALLRSADSPSRWDRRMAVESLMALTDRDSPTIRDVLVAAVRRAVRTASFDLGGAVEQSSIERRAVLGVLALEDRLAAVGNVGEPPDPVPI